MTENLARVTTLPSGFRVVSKRMPWVETASIGVWVDVGARYEPAAVNGVAHMLEHMAFKGTRSRSARRIAEEIESVGGALNAYTSREHTAYYARVLASDVPLAAALIADILQRSTFEPKELEKERHVVLQEIGETRDTPDELVFDLFQEVAYPDQPMGRSILGPEAVVAKLPREALLDYMARHYGPSRLVLAGAGKIEHERLVDLADALFEELPDTAGEPAEPARYVGGTRIAWRKDLEQVHLCLGWQGLPIADPDYWPLQVLSTALGGGMSSRLFQECRENRGLCYTIGSYCSAYADTGLLSVYTGTGADDLADLLPIVAGETGKLVAEATEAEVDRARAQLKASLLMGLESCSAECEAAARQLLSFGRPLPTSEIVARLDAVDAAAVRRVGRRLLADQPATVVALGPVRALPAVDLDHLAT